MKGPYPMAKGTCVVNGTPPWRYFMRSVLGITLLSLPGFGQCMQWEAHPINREGRCLSVFDDGYGGGQALYFGADGAVFKRTPTSLQLLGDELNGGVNAVCGYDSGLDSSIYAGGDFTAMYWTGQWMWHIVKLNGSTYSDVGGGLPSVNHLGSVRALSVFDDGSGSKLYVGGQFTSVPSLNSNNIVRWDGTSWSGVGSGLSGIVFAMCVFDAGSGPALYASSYVNSSSGTIVGGISKWDGATWTIISPELTLNGQTAGASCLTVFDDGTGPALYAGGVFNFIGTLSANGLAKWTGTTWSAVPGIPSQPILDIFDMTVHDDGTGPALYLALQYAPFGWHSGLIRWDGTHWSSVGGQQDGYIEAIAAYDNGAGGESLYAAGNFQHVGGNISSIGFARWNDTCTHSIDPFCFGDGSYAPCPCSNYGSLGHGCGNAASASGALLSASGSTNPDALVLSSSSESTTSTSLFLQSDALGMDYSVLGDGLLCLGGQIHRMYLKPAVAGTALAPQAGDLSISQRSAALGDPIQPGSLRYYQVWYRDNAAYCNPGRSNLSNGLRVVW